MGLPNPLARYLAVRTKGVRFEPIHVRFQIPQSKCDRAVHRGQLRTSVAGCRRYAEWTARCASGHLRFRAKAATLRADRHKLPAARLRALRLAAPSQTKGATAYAIAPLYFPLLDSDGVRFLAVQGDVETLLFGRFVDLHARYEVDDPQRHPSEDEHIGAAQHGGRELLAQERRVAAQQTVGTVRVPQRRCEYAE